MTAETPPIRRTSNQDIRTIHKRIDSLSDRVVRVERAVYVGIGIGIAGGGTALLNLLNGSN